VIDRSLSVVLKCRDWGRRAVSDLIGLFCCLARLEKRILPSSCEENRVKSDRLPSKTRLHASRHQITDWWQQAWQSESEKQRFFVEAAMSLPNVGYNCTDFDLVFEALQFQSAGIQQRLQVAEW